MAIFCQIKKTMQCKTVTEKYIKLFSAKYKQKVGWVTINCRKYEYRHIVSSALLDTRLHAFLNIESVQL